MAAQPFARFDVRRAIGQERNPTCQVCDGERVGSDGRWGPLLGQVSDNGLAVIRTTRATDLVKLWVQQLLQSCAIATDARVMKLDLEGLKNAEQRIHGGGLGVCR